MKFSVVIPCYNRSLQLLLTLAAFEKQTCPPDQFEIIVVDDGSQDDTLEKLRSYRSQAPYRLVIVSVNETKGRSVARNIGVAAAGEDYIIFCDPDFLVTPDFINVHASYHSRHPDSIVSGIPNLWMGAYTQLHSDFSHQEKVSMSEVLKKTGLWQDHYFSTPETLEIVTPEDIRHQNDRLAKVVAPYEAGHPVNQQFKKTDVAPWLLSVTRCLSLPKKLFKQVRGFHEKFQKHGLEDWELGYRLHKCGYKFVSIEETIGYHQEHPSAMRNEDKGNENLKLIYQTHGFLDPELSLFAVCPPSERIEVYKNTLRVLKSWKTGKRKLYRSLAARVTRACTRNAKLFYNQPGSAASQQIAAALNAAFTASDEIYRQPLTKTVRHRKISVIMSKACKTIAKIPAKA
ncbi:GT2 family glycosyltransferase [Fontibacillus phaseoli]|uniref:GT2 family glycosyltransferase n=1 Tax=Fontibacillus phaseoli TaxID=1416533 RepID=A0A369BAX5_9BACL|nr:glycosyltransferase family 2 protein [Fontibacillus phaseoli]RCX18680.1 GT2 family glycosyltransferase [Fontibacillus phaseoli]